MQMYYRYTGKRVRVLVDVPSCVWDRDAQIFIGVGPRSSAQPGFMTQFRWSLDVVWDWFPSLYWCYGWRGYDAGVHRAKYSESHSGPVYDSRAWTGRRCEMQSWSWFWRFKIKKDY